MAARYAVVAMVTPYEQVVLFDGRSTKLAVLALAARHNLLTGQRTVVCRHGKGALGKLVEEFGSDSVT